MRISDWSSDVCSSDLFEGVIGNLNRRLLQTESAWMREELSKYHAAQPCEVCHGARLKPEALAVKVAMRDISSVTCLSVVDALAFFQAPPADLTAPQNEIASSEEHTSELQSLIRIS